MQVIDKAVEVLQLMANDPSKKFWRVTDVSNGLDMNVSTTHRLMQSLRNSGIIHQDNSTKKYSLGINFIYYGGIVREMNIPGIVIYPLMQRLYDELGETVFVTIKDRDNCVVLERINSYHQLRFVKRIGETLKLHEGACGKVILAYLPVSILDRTIERIVEGEEHYDIEKLKKTISEVREKGYLVEEVPKMDSTTFSAPVFSVEGNYVASLSVVIPKCRLTESKTSETIRVLKEIVAGFMVDTV
ncbi:helix-turn-helix domain-containing protein [Alkalibaculum sp. M08DMB]|uniref:Helix-turn-helix domain-containing protein n=1 Tax=Alkalibaculum sporogenes TaxID=2655001 RepID=A0A6A7KC70_9FIRM|nr:IclR family transcriptional regulator [Alkalibaculum sporogenes]MPW26891.1 helix-turn-helix domain-containing protein [Alkalibaculum sporogenes]